MAIAHSFDLGTNEILLILIVVFHIAFLVVEGVASQMSSSLSLLSDALHSALDVGTFLINLWAESRIRRAGNQNLYVEIGAPISKEHHGYNDLRMQIARRKESAEWWEFVASMVTGVSLLLSTVYVFYESVERMMESQPNDEINAPILIWIVGATVVINGMILLAFCCLPGYSISHCHAHSHGHSHAHAHSHANGTNGDINSREDCDEINTNMFSALIHVCADQVQNMVLIVVAVLIRFEIGNPIYVDAVGSITTCIGTVILACIVIRISIAKRAVLSDLKATSEKRAISEDMSRPLLKT